MEQKEERKNGGSQKGNGLLQIIEDDRRLEKWNIHQ